MSIEGDMTPLSRAFGKARGVSRREGLKAGKAYTIGFGDMMRAAGTMASGGFIVRTLSEASKAAERFEGQMSRVSTMLRGDTAKGLSSMRDGLQQLAANSGVSTDQLSDGLYDVLSASIKAKDAMGVLGTATQAAVGGFVDVRTVADVTTTAINAYGLSAEPSLCLTPVDKVGIC